MVGLDNSTAETRLIEQAQQYLHDLAEQRTPDAATQAAWEEFYAICSQWIDRFVASMGVPINARDDCAQDVWINLLRYLRHLKYDPQRGQFRTWLYTLTRSAGVDFHRGRNRETLLGEADDVPLRTTACRAAIGLEAADQQQQVGEVLTAARQALSQTNYQLLHMRFMEERSVDDVAASLGLTARQVWFRQHRIKKKLQTLFKEDRQGAKVGEKPDPEALRRSG